MRDALTLARSGAGVLEREAARQARSPKSSASPTASTCTRSTRRCFAATARRLLRSDRRVWHVRGSICCISPSSGSTSRATGGAARGRRPSQAGRPPPRRTRASAGERCTRARCWSSSARLLRWPSWWRRSAAPAPRRRRWRWAPCGWRRGLPCATYPADRASGRAREGRLRPGSDIASWRASAPGPGTPGWRPAQCTWRQHSLGREPAAPGGSRGPGRRGQGQPVLSLHPEQRISGHIHLACGSAGRIHRERPAMGQVVPLPLRSPRLRLAPVAVAAAPAFFGSRSDAPASSAAAARRACPCPRGSEQPELKRNERRIGA